MDYLNINYTNFIDSLTSNLQIFRPAMSSFIGIAINDDIDPDMYQQAIIEMQHAVLQAGLRVPTHEHIFIITNGLQSFSLSKKSHYLHSHLQHLIVNQIEDEQLIEAIVQCLMILKQYFPSKLEIQLASDLDLIYNIKKMIEQQIPRRLAGNLKVLYDKGKKQYLNKTEINRLIYTLQDQIHKEYKHKLRTLALKTLIEAKIRQKQWNSLEREQIRIIDSLSNDPLYQKLGIQVLQKIVRHNEAANYCKQEQENIDPNIIYENDLQKQSQTQNQFSGKIDVKTAFFQLKQSHNLSRISWIIQNLLQQKLTEKQQKKLSSRIQQICHKILQGKYQVHSKQPYLHFKNSLSKYRVCKQIGQKDSFYNKIQNKISSQLSK